MRDALEILDDAVVTVVALHREVGLSEEDASLQVSNALARYAGALAGQHAYGELEIQKRSLAASARYEDSARRAHDNLFNRLRRGS